MADVEGTEYLAFEEFKDTVMNMLNALGTDHICIRLSNGAELDINYKPNLVNLYYDEKVVEIEL